LAPGRGETPLLPGGTLSFGGQPAFRASTEGFIHEPWVAELDLSTLERVNGSYVTADAADGTTARRGGAKTPAPEAA